MRLSPKEHKAITSAFENLFRAATYELFLFGSRTDDGKRGGDIDLLVIVGETEKPLFVDSKIKIKNEIFKLIDEQRIDITVAIELKSRIA